MCLAPLLQPQVGYIWHSWIWVWIWIRMLINLHQHPDLHQSDCISIVTPPPTPDSAHRSRSRTYGGIVGEGITHTSLTDGARISLGKVGRRWAVQPPVVARVEDAGRAWPDPGRDVAASTERVGGGAIMQSIVTHQKLQAPGCMGYCGLGGAQGRTWWDDRP